MIKLNRKTEYGLLALRYLSKRDEGHVASVSDIATCYQMSNELLSKVMQRLKNEGLVSSIKGVSGGYTLSIALERMSFLDYLQIFEEDTALIDCLTLDHSCQQLNGCDIRGPLSVVNAVIQQQFRILSLQDLFNIPNTANMMVPASALISNDA